MAHQGGPGTGALGGPPTGHNYKRAVYRPPPKEFTVEVLPPTKLGSNYCYGMRICSLLSELADSRSTRSGSSFSEYDVWRRWEDCLWFQSILESEYALMSRQKRARLVAGKGVKKNGIYVHSDQAASFESLPPGPDANTIAKDIHELIPQLNKKGTLFRASQSTIEQRGREFEALIHALWQEDVPMLIQELRETRLVRDFFGYWRRDLDYDRKRQSISSKGTSVRNSVSSSAFSMYFSASNISLHLPNVYAELPRSPALPSSRSPLSQDASESRRTSAHRDVEESRRIPAGRASTPAPVAIASYAASESSASTVSVGDVPHSPTPSSASHSQSQAQDLTFYVSARGSLALSVADDDARAEYINAPLSAPARVQRSFPSQEDEAEFVTQVDVGKPAPSLVRQESISAPVVGDFQPGLQALPEDSELVPAYVALASTPMGIASHSDIEQVSRAPIRRPRNNSCPDRSNRQCMFIPADAPRSVNLDGVFSLPPSLHLNSEALHQSSSREAETALRTPTTQSSSSGSRTSSAAWSGFSGFAGESRRSSWRTSMASDASFAQSFATSFANGSCADFDMPSRHSFATSFTNGSCADSQERDSMWDIRHSIASVLSSNGRQTALAHRESMSTLNTVLSDLTIDSDVLPRSYSPPPRSTGSLTRSLSAGSRRPPSILASRGGQEDWYEQSEDFIDAYFYDPGIHSSVSVPTTAFIERPRTPPPPTQREPTKEVSTPDRFPKPFQNRPPGQFHLPWSPPSTPGPEHPTSPPPAPRPQTATYTPTSPNSPSVSIAPGESVTLKAVLEKSIVLLRVSRSESLHDVRRRLRDKFAMQEGVQLSSAFVVGWAPAASGSGSGSSYGGGGVGSLAALRGRPRSNSASSVGTLNPQALRYVYTEQEWGAAVRACVGGKMTIRLFNAQPI